MNRYGTSTVAMIFVGALAACSADATDDAAPAVESVGITPRQDVTNPTNGWTMSALTPERNANGDVRGGVIFGGSGSALAGACLLLQYKDWNGNPVPCTSQATVATDCAAAPSSVPVGGGRYCAVPNGDPYGQATCFYRPGTQTAFCAGSPAVGGSAIGQGTYYTDWKPDYSYPMGPFGATTTFVTYGCFNACNPSSPTPTPSVSYDLTF